MNNVMIRDLTDTKELDATAMSKIAGGIFKKNGKIPGYKAPDVIYDDGINVQTTSPFSTNVEYDSPFTPIPNPA